MGIIGGGLPYWASLGCRGARQESGQPSAGFLYLEGDKQNFREASLRRCCCLSRKPTSAAYISLSIAPRPVPMTLGYRPYATSTLPLLLAVSALSKTNCSYLKRFRTVAIFVGITSSVVPRRQSVPILQLLLLLLLMPLLLHSLLLACTCSCL